MNHPPKTVVVDWLNTIWETNLPYQSKYLACYLRKFMNAQHDMAYPSYARIIHETGLSRMTVSRYLKALEDEGWLVRDRGNVGKNTTYTACFPTSITQRLVSERAPTSTTQSKTSIREVHELNNSKQGINNTMVEGLFNRLWSEFPTKKKKKESLATFTRILKKQSDPEEFTEMLISDIQTRIAINQFGFNKIHPTTYLNGERWTDDKVINDENPKGFTTANEKRSELASHTYDYEKAIDF